MEEKQRPGNGYKIWPLKFCYYQPFRNPLEGTNAQSQAMSEVGPLSFLLQIQYIKSTAARAQIALNSVAWEWKLEEVRRIDLPVHISSHTPPPPSPALVCAELTEAPLSLEGKHSGACVYELVLMGYRVFSGRGRCYAEGWGGCVAAACKLFGCSVLPAGRRCTVWEWECWSIFQVRSANISW